MATAPTDTARSPHHHQCRRSPHCGHHNSPSAPAHSCGPHGNYAIRDCRGPEYGLLAIGGGPIDRDAFAEMVLSLPSTTSVGAPAVLRSWGSSSDAGARKDAIARAMCTRPSNSPRGGRFCCRGPDLPTSGPITGKRSISNPTGQLGVGRPPRQWDGSMFHGCAWVIWLSPPSENSRSPEHHALSVHRGPRLHFAEALAYERWQFSAGLIRN